MGVLLSVLVGPLLWRARPLFLPFIAPGLEKDLHLLLRGPLPQRVLPSFTRGESWQAVAVVSSLLPRLNQVTKLSTWVC